MDPLLGIMQASLPARRQTACPGAEGTRTCARTCHAPEQQAQHGHPHAQAVPLLLQLMDQLELRSV
jgi:hypothetical protein